MIEEKRMICRLCEQREIDYNLFNIPERRIMECEKVCFNCAFWWLHSFNDKRNPNAFVIDGVHYVVGKEYPENTPNFLKGFGGSKYKIKPFNSDEIIITTNLWYQGTIPHIWKDKFPNNAEFIKEYLCLDLKNL